ncbi:hypothetical protein LUZ62_069944 [Rhynchospora pubera]|uniref:Transcription factor TFIIIC triple barrel domain-containing protein n=1 Tax=Rhynchospora pubera TaxID=906938 RepID=A0AAV8CUW4_9POAL|nr:hypothetical protein LUZ62_069944 [Rhynchospora pubera]
MTRTNREMVQIFFAFFPLPTALFLNFFPPLPLFVGSLQLSKLLEMEVNKEMYRRPDYEEEFIFLDLDDCLYSDIPPNAPFVLSGLDTLSPTLQIGDHLKLVGEYQETVGTCYIFSESGPSSNEKCPTDQSHAPSKEVKPLASLQKILKFKVCTEDGSKANVATIDD